MLEFRLFLFFLLCMRIWRIQSFLLQDDSMDEVGREQEMNAAAEVTSVLSESGFTINESTEILEIVIE